MKQAILSFGKADVLLVQLPENIVRVEPSYCHAIITYDNTGYIETEYPLGDDSPHVIEPLGKLSTLTEEQFAEIVDKRGTAYERYMKANTLLRIGGYSSITPTAKKSFLSKMEAEGYFTVNPHGNKPADDDYSFFTDVNITLKEAWAICEARTFPPDQTYVFIILKQQDNADAKV